jgi:methyl coenzyme M reductase subunit C
MNYCCLTHLFPSRKAAAIDNKRLSVLYLTAGYITLEDNVKQDSNVSVKKQKCAVQNRNNRHALTAMKKNELSSNIVDKARRIEEYLNFNRLWH